MTSPATLVLQSCSEDSWNSNQEGGAVDVPEGLQVTSEECSYEHEGETHFYWDHTYRLPEAGPDRCFSAGQFYEGIVLPINGRNYRVVCSLHPTEYGCEGGSVTFIPTDEPATEYEAWSEEETLEAFIQRNQRSLTRAQEELAPYLAGEKEPEYAEMQGYLESDIKRAQQEIKRAQDGEYNFHPTTYANAFGQPYFKQGESINVHEGRCAMCLMTLETGWGDSGNVNIMFACDEDGVPCRVWFNSASC